ncbi:MAG: NAD-dependent epimerase/dehydratase family protein [Inquilinaceae bacterium]
MKIQRLLITGAAGALGTALRQRLAGEYPILRLSDRADMGPAAANEEIHRCELTDREAVDRMLDGVDAVIHLGGQPVEAPWDVIIGSNLLGAINVWEAARKAGTRRILFASSNHAIGFYPRRVRLNPDSPPRPDTRYGLSKAFGEDLAQFYAMKHGISALCMRIGSCFPEPTDERMLSTWLSYDDLARLCRAGLTADYHFEIVYGVSRNDRAWWDNTNAALLGYDPQDNAETFADRLVGKVSDDPLVERFQGGGFLRPDYTGDPDWLDP